MSHIFYLIGLIAIIWEIIVVTSPQRVVNTMASMKGKKVEGVTKTQKALSFYMLGYLLWCLVGLFSSQWVLFGFILLLGLIPKKNIVMCFLNGLISLGLLVFIILNAYHLHINVLSLVKSYF
jgi:hypothetical protein